MLEFRRGIFPHIIYAFVAKNLLSKETLMSMDMVSLLVNKNTENLKKSTMEYRIKISGQGKAIDIAVALRKVASAIQHKSVRDRLDSPEIDDLDGAEWEDCTLMTEIVKLEEGEHD